MGSLNVAIDQSLSLQKKEKIKITSAAPHLHLTQRPSTPRSFRIITWGNKHKFNYYAHRNKPALLKLPGYSWLNSDQQSSVMTAYRDNRTEWLRKSNAEEEEKQRHQKIMFAKMKAKREQNEKQIVN